MRYERPSVGGGSAPSAGGGGGNPVHLAAMQNDLYLNVGQQRYIVFNKVLGTDAEVFQNDYPFNQVYLLETGYYSVEVRIAANFDSVFEISHLNAAGDVMAGDKGAQGTDVGGTSRDVMGRRVIKVEEANQSVKVFLFSSSAPTNLRGSDAAGQAITYIRIERLADL